ncbi:hypothetical protein ACPF7Z_08880 [Halomonas sp. GXIMD04776]|uniref:hypothetical protein n=1 Tax=Halomonas sp. GXIMD04776 TaxID=3415605 RepID=UPI003C939CB8
MAKNKRNAKRQRALNARRNAAAQESGSFIANELHHLVGADEEDVVRAFRWRAKFCVYFIYGINILGFFFLLNFTSNSQGGVVEQTHPYIWGTYIAFVALQLAFLRRYKRLIRNA